MSEAVGASFNVLTDPWVPLDRGDRVELASFVELLAGEKDAADLSHPREDVPFFSRMLLSALVQALFAPKDAAELRERIAAPLPRAMVEARIADVREDFELLGNGRFLQEKLPDELRSRAPLKDLNTNDTALLLLDEPRKDSQLFKEPRSYVGLCTACAVPIAYGNQAFVAGDGQSKFGLKGKAAGVRGSPPLTSLILGKTIRVSSWLNVLSRDAALDYAPDAARPWRQAAKVNCVDAALGLVEGLFWQPRAFHFEPCHAGTCPGCGAESVTLLRATEFRSKSHAKECLYVHPYCPYRPGKTPLEPVKYLFLNPSRPAWTSLADVVGASDKNESRPAPVVAQAFELELIADEQSVSLSVFNYLFDRVKPGILLGRFVEIFPLSRFASQNASTVRALVAEAEAACSALRKALFVSLSTSDKGAPLLDEFVASFWQRSERHFWSAYYSLEGEVVELVGFRRALVDVCLGIFDEVVEPYQNDPVVLAESVRRRRKLCFGLEVELGLRDRPAKPGPTTKPLKGKAKAPTKDGAREKSKRRTKEK